MKPVAALLALALLAGIGIARAQEATPTPAFVAETAPVEAVPVAPDATLAVLPTGEKVVAIAVPPNAEPEEVKAIAETSAETQRDVADGDVPIGQATRKMKDTFDSGDGNFAGQLFWYLSFFFGAVFRPQVVGRIRKAWPAGWPPLSDKRERWLNAALQFAFFAAAFYLLHGLIPSAPQTIGGWLLAAGVGVAGGSTMKRADDAPLIPAAAPPRQVRR